MLSINGGVELDVLFDLPGVPCDPEPGGARCHSTSPPHLPQHFGLQTGEPREMLQYTTQDKQSGLNIYISEKVINSSTCPLHLLSVRGGGVGGGMGGGR